MVIRLLTVITLLVPRPPDLYRGHHPTLHKARLPKCLQPARRITVVSFHPFVPPSESVGHQAFVSPGTMACSAPLAASGITGAPAVSGCTQGRTARNEQNVQDFASNFNPLPLTVVSPINVDVLERFLAGYPCPSTSRYLITGFRYGFDIGFRGSFEDPNARPRNLLSARENVAQVSEAVLKELSRGHTSGPFPYPPFAHTHCSPIGSAPKPDGSVRLILDLSSPRGQSVNDGISKEEFTCKYSKFDDAVSIVLHLGRGAFLGKIDIKHAFRICPVAPEQWPLLCFQWLGQFFTDTRLPFGSRSSPFIFNTFAMALAWIVVNVGGLLFLIHYLDDYFIANLSRRGCRGDMDTFLHICAQLGVPIAEDKSEGPSTCIIYLGIEIDTVAMTVRLPAEKMEKIQLLAREWSATRKCTKRELLSLIGLLAFACKVVKPGRIFLRRLIDLSTTVSSLDHHIYLNAEARADIDWWLNFFPDWNGLAIIHPTPITSIELKLFTDASDVGLGCVYGKKWLFSGWREDWAPSLRHHINLRELFAVWAAVFTWGQDWEDREIVIFTDNQSVVDVWKTGTCTDALMMKVIRAIFFRAAKLNLNIILAHVAGVDNIDADMLSRFQVQEFRSRNPQADREPTTLLDAVWELSGTP